MKLPLTLPWLLCSAALLIANTAHADPTAGGTQIPNSATASYTPPAATTPVQSVSNTVINVVPGQCQVTISPNGTVEQPGQTATIFAGETATLHYTVSNTGNITSGINLSIDAAQLTGVDTIKIYLDANKNGLLDSGEVEVSSVNLDAQKDAQIIVLVKTSPSASSALPINLIGSCGTSVDNNNVGVITLAESPNLSITKTFEPPQIRPNEETTVKIVATNSGGTSGEVIISDPLLLQQQSGLVLVPGSAGLKGASGTIEYFDGQNWLTTAPNSVEGIRVRASAVAAGAVLELTFKMKALAQAENRNFINRAELVSSTSTLNSDAVLKVKYNPNVAIGPKGNAQAPEGTPEDTQTQPFLPVGSEACFEHTVTNTGDVADNFTFDVALTTGQATVQLKDASGNPLPVPMTLAPGASQLVNACYTPTAAGSLNAVLTVKGERGTSNTTRDLISTIVLGLPELKKDSNASTDNPLSLGSVLTYTLSVHNSYTIPLNNVVVTDQIPASTDYVSSSQAPEVKDGLLTWRLPVLAPGETRVFTVTVKVNDKAQDGEKISNTFYMGSKEFTKPLPSNSSEAVVWEPAHISIEKNANAPVVTPGDSLTYTLVIHNTSEKGALKNSIVTDTPASGLDYIPGTTTIDGKALGDPDIANGSMNWNVGTLLPKTDVTIIYKMRVTPKVSGDLINTVQVSGYTGDALTTRKVASNRATALVRPKLRNFAPYNDLVGTVFVDRNRNGLFDKALDTPVERARIILAGGRLALTDKDGRYHFANVALGTQALRLDPVTTPYDPLNTPQSQGLSGTQTVFVRGLTSVDFPLAPVGGDITAIRRTSLVMGDMHLDKVVYRTTQGYAVVLKLNSPAPLSDFVLTDPLPTGATLQEGSNIWKGTLPAGETNLSYSFGFSGPDEAAVTDPDVVWRY